jgi:hypothetical protein
MSQRKALTFTFISDILLFGRPGPCEVLGTVCKLVDVATIISLLGTVGNVTRDVYSIADRYR